MRFSDVASINDSERIRELAPMVTPGVAPAPAAPGAQAPQSGLAGGQMDPAQAAQAAKQRQEQKKQIQDQIKAAEQQLTDLRKRLAELG